jgi:hypothetical protein
MNELWIALFPFVLFFAWLYFFGMGHRKPCPDCNKPLPLIQSPFTKSKRQWFEGGYICRNCGCETSLAGDKVVSGLGARPGFAVRSVLLVTPSAVAGAAMLFYILDTQEAPPPIAVAPPFAVPAPSIETPAPPLVAPPAAVPVREARVADLEC